MNFTNLLNKLAVEKNSIFISLNGNHELMNILGNFSYVSKKSFNQNRINNFKIKGNYRNILGNRPIIVRINDLIFCHAGLKKKHLDILKKYDKDIFYLNIVWSNFVLLNKIENKYDKEILNEIILNDDGILWTRNLDNIDDIDYVLNNIECKYMFIGHNTVNNIKLVNKIWFTDSGLSRAYGKNNFEYIQIINKNIKIIKL